MIVVSDYRGEILDLNVRGATREGCMAQGDKIAGQYFGTQEPLKRYVASVGPDVMAYDQRVTQWIMHVYYRRVVDCASPFSQTKDLETNRCE